MKIEFKKIKEDDKKEGELLMKNHIQCPKCKIHISELVRAKFDRIKQLEKELNKAINNFKGEEYTDKEIWLDMRKDLIEKLSQIGLEELKNE
ncbi:MAG: hypothetical protein ACOC5T_01620 [Elusimicrobiota bacterium]